MVLSPSEISERVEPLVVEVETAVGSGLYRVDPRLRVDEVRLASDDVFSSADIAVRLDNDFDALSARQRYHPDRRVVVRTNEADASDRTILLQGYLRLQEAVWSGIVGRQRDALTLQAIHVYERLSRDRVAQIFGRRMRNAEIDDGLGSDPTQWQEESVLVESLPCIFNPDGVANCSPTSLVTSDAEGNPRAIHIFTYDNDLAAIEWTYLNAIRYLLWFYSISGGPIDAGSALEATEPYVGVSPNERFSVSGGGHLIQQLLQQADSLVCETSNLAEALADAVMAADVHLTAETVNSGGSVESRIRLWVPQDGTLKNLKLARGGRFADGSARFDSRSKTAEQVLDANNVFRGKVEWSFRTIVNAPVILGGARQYEFTLPLAPGWKPEANLDNVDPADRAAAKDVVIPQNLIPLLDEDPNNFDWYRKYHRSGNDFADYKDVARKWVLNEAGGYDAATYNRNAPFDNYQVFDWSTVADDSVAAPGEWARRTRRVLDSVTRAFLGKGGGVYPEVSFDSGSTWHPMLFQRITALDSEAGVYFGIANLTSITPPLMGPLEQNMWWAIIDQTFRVRVTGVIESDQRLISEWPASEYFTPGVQVHSDVVDSSKTFLFITRDGVTNNLVQPGDDLGDLVADDSDGIAVFAAETSKAHHDRRLTSAPVIPWLETEYGIGDQLGKIQGREIDFGTRIGHDVRYPAVVGVTYRLKDRYETELKIESPDVLVGV